MSTFGEYHKYTEDQRDFIIHVGNIMRRGHWIFGALITACISLQGTYLLLTRQRLESSLLAVVTF